MEDYFIGHGIVYAAQRDISGNPLGFIDLGNCPRFTISPGTRGLRSVTNPANLGKMLEKGEVGNVQITLDDLNKNNLAQAFYGGQIAQAGTTVVDESVTVYTGLFSPTAHINISNVSVAGKVEGTDYTVDVAGGLHVIDGTGSPWSVSYDYTDHNIMSSFSLAPEIQWVRLNGINIADDENPVVVDVYKVRFTPASNISLIGDTFVSMALTGKILYDSTKAGTTTWGNYFRIRSL